MKTLETVLHMIRQAGEVMFVSLEPKTVESFNDWAWRDLDLPLSISEERVELPVVSAELEMWACLGDDESSQDWPHLVYTCPRCKQLQNSDLYATDASPRFACCDSCGWSSMCWLDWNPPDGWRPYEAIVWKGAADAVGIRATVYASSVEAAKQRLIFEFGRDITCALHNEENAEKVR